jgi:hypothetical protein
MKPIKPHPDLGLWLDRVFQGDPQAPYQGDDPRTLEEIRANPLALAFYQSLFFEKLDQEPKRAVRRNKARVTKA